MLTPHLMQNPIAVSTWSLHRHLGASFANGPGQVAPFVKSNTWGADDFSQCLAAAKRGKYQGPMTLIFHDEGDEWQGLEAERQFIRHN